MELRIPHSSPQTHWTILACDHS